MGQQRQRSIYQQPRLTHNTTPGNEQGTARSATSWREYYPQVIELVLAEILHLGVALNHGADSDTEVLDTATVRLDERTQTGIPRVGKVAAVNKLKRLEGGSRLGAGRVVGCCVVSARRKKKKSEWSHDMARSYPGLFVNKASGARPWCHSRRNSA